MNGPLMNLENIFSPYEADIYSNGPIPSIDVIRELEPDFHFDRNALYIGTVSQMPRNISGITCALTSDAPLSDEITSGNNIFLFPLNVQPCLLLSKAEDYIRERSQFSRRADKIKNVYLRKGDLSSIIDISCEMLGHSIIVADFGMSVIAFSENANDEKFDDENILQPYLGFIPAQSFCKEAEEVCWKDSIPGTAFFFYRVHGGEPDVIVRLLEQNSLLAYLIVKSGGRPFEYWDKEIIGVISGIVLAKLMDISRLMPTRKYSRDQFICRLLDGGIKNSGDMMSGADCFGLESYTHFCLLTVSLSQYEQSIMGAAQLRDRLKNLTGSDYIVAHSGNVVAILCYCNEHDFTERDLQPVIDYLRECNLYCAKSRLFSQLADAQKHYLRTRDMLELYFCLDDGNYFITEDGLGLFPFISSIMQTLNTEHLISPVIDKLADIDIIRNTAYLKTLYMYIKCGKNPRLTCNKLFIHRNTLDYRIRKITELTEIDWDDGDLLFRLFLSVEVIRFTKCRDEAQKSADIPY